MLEQVKGVVRSLNPEADILTSVRSRIDLKRVLDTKKFSFEKSVLSAGWLQSLREEHKPETEEYGIGTCVALHPPQSSSALIAVPAASYTVHVGLSPPSASGRWFGTVWSSSRTHTRKL